MTKEFLEQRHLVEKCSLASIARDLGCTPALVSIRMTEFGLSRLPRGDVQRRARRKTWTKAEREAQMIARAKPEYREKLSVAKRGDKAPHWRGGKIPGEQARMQRWEWRERRKECYARDNWTCKDCAVKCSNNVRIAAHHIIPRRLGGTDELANLVTLCASCHRKREHRYSDALIA